MANEEHLRLLKSGSIKWNEWRERNRKVKPDLSDTDLKGIKLYDFNLEGANLKGSNLSGSNLRGSTLRGANLQGTDFTGAKLRLIDFGGVKVSKQTCFVESNFYKARLDGSVFINVNFDRARLIKANMDSSNFSESSFGHACLIKAKINHGTLSRAGFGNAKLCQSELNNAKLIETVLFCTDLEEAELNSTDLTNAKLRLTNLKNAKLSKASLVDCDLREIFGFDHHSFQLDDTHIKNTRFPLSPRDPWSLLRREYSGPMLFINLVFLSVFSGNYSLQSLFWLGVNKFQTLFSQHMTKITDIYNQSIPEQELLTSTPLTPCLSQTCQEPQPLIAVLLGYDKGWLVFLLTVFLVIYNILRGIITWQVSLLRDQEERSHYSPPFKSGGKNKGLIASLVLYANKKLYRIKYGSSYREYVRHVNNYMQLEFISSLAPIRTEHPTPAIPLPYDYSYGDCYHWLYFLHIRVMRYLKILPFLALLELIFQTLLQTSIVIPKGLEPFWG